MLYDSLHARLLKFPDDTEIFPAHGAGSLCGRQMSSERSSTIGKERRTNYALQARSREDFVQLLTGDLPPRPEYFIRDVEMNRQGAGAIDQIPPPKPFPASEVLRLQSEGAVVLDTRPPMQFAVAHVPGSIHIGLSGQYASWAARILGLDKQIILVGEDPVQLRESQMRLARVGIENTHACLEDGISGWIAGGYELDYIPQITVQEFSELLGKESGGITVLDVREASEVTAGAMENSVRIPLGQLQGRTGELNRSALQERLPQFNRYQHSAPRGFSRHREPDRRIRCLEGDERGSLRRRRTESPPGRPVAPPRSPTLPHHWIGAETCSCTISHLPS